MGKITENNIKQISTHKRYISRVSSESGESKGSGSGGGGGMEYRVARLESDVGDIKTSLAVLIQKVDGMAESVSDIKAAVSKLPTSEVIQSRFELIESKVTELSGKVSNRPSEDKINAKFTEVNSKIEVESAKTETKINSARLQVILWVLGGLPAITFGIYRLYLAYKGS